jgi:hypothetical protein
MSKISKEQRRLTMKKKAYAYLEGLCLTYLAMLVFCAVGWINIGATFAASHFLVPLLMAVVIWTAMYILSYAVWILISMFAACTMGIGFLIGLGVLGYVAMRLAAFVMPIGWISFTDDNFVLFLMGGSIGLIDLIINEKIRPDVVGSVKEKE